VFEVYPEHYSADYAPKTASYEKSVYTDCLRLVESVDFDIKIVSIRDRMQKLRPLQDYCYSQERYYRSNKRYYRSYYRSYYRLRKFLCACFWTLETLSGTRAVLERYYRLKRYYRAPEAVLPCPDSGRFWNSEFGWYF